MRFTEAIDAAYKGSKVKRSIWRPSCYLFADEVFVYIHYTDGIIDDYKFNKEEFYATDWEIVE